MNLLTKLLDRLWRYYGRKRNFFDRSANLIRREDGLVLRATLDGDATFIATVSKDNIQSVTLYNLHLTNDEVEHIIRTDGEVPAWYKFGPSTQ